MPFETFSSQNEQREQQEREIVEERSGLFGKIFERILSEKEEGARELEEMKGMKKKAWEIGNDIPVWGASRPITEGIYKAEPGRKLSTKEALLKVAAGFYMIAEDAERILGKTEGKAQPDKKKGWQFESKLISWMDDLAQESTSDNDKGERASSNFFGIVGDFLKKNSDIVISIESKVAEAAKRERGTKS